MIRLGTDEGGQERMVDIDDVMRVGRYHLVADITGKDDKRDILFLQQLHFGSFHLSLVRVVFLDAPYIIRNTELLSHIAQVFVIRYDTGYVAGKLARLPTSQQVVQTVAHLADEQSHARTLIAVIQAELHLIALGIQRSDIIIDFLAWNLEPFQFPFYTHEEHPLYLIDILIQINDVSLVIRYKLCYVRNDTLLVGAMQ